MKKIVIFFVFILIFTSEVSAHPGREDENGCHTCRTNCEYYGLDYGEYHCFREPTYTNYGYSSKTNDVSDKSSGFAFNDFIVFIIVCGLLFKTFRFIERNSNKK